MIIPFKDNERFTLNPAWDNDGCKLTWILERQIYTEVGFFRKHMEWRTYTEEVCYPDDHWFEPQIWRFDSIAEAQKKIKEMQVAWKNYMEALGINSLRGIKGSVRTNINGKRTEENN